jgi:Na+/melibiose symporter-like transporter
MTNPNSPKTNDGTVREDRTTDYGRFVPWLLLIIGLSILWFLKMNK